MTPVAVELQEKRGRQVALHMHHAVLYFEAPAATVDLVDGRRRVRGHAATRDERSRLWARWREIDPNLDGYAARRPSETAVVVLEPVPPEG